MKPFFSAHVWLCCGLICCIASMNSTAQLTVSEMSTFTPVPGMMEGTPMPRKMSDVRQILGTSLSPQKKAAQKPLRVVLCASEKDALHLKIGLHDYPLWQSRWTRLLNTAENVSAEPAIYWPDAEQWKNADLIVLYSNNPAWAFEKDSLKVAARSWEIERFLQRGGGLVLIHYAVNAEANAPILSKYIGLTLRKGTRYRLVSDGWDLDKKHPLAAGFTDWQITDESYWNLYGNLDEKSSVVLSRVEENGLCPQIWTRQYGNGRVFVSIPGHYTWTFDDPFYRILVFRGMMWAAGQPLDRLAPLSIVGARVEP